MTPLPHAVLHVQLARHAPGQLSSSAPSHSSAVRFLTPSPQRAAVTVVGSASAPGPGKPAVWLIAVPLVVQSYGVFAIGLVGARLLRLPHEVAGPACLIGTSNFFELAVAVAISLFGLDSGAALATVVGVLVEVPVMLSLVAIVNRTRHWYGRAAAPASPGLGEEVARP